MAKTNNGTVMVSRLRYGNDPVTNALRFSISTQAVDSMGGIRWIREIGDSTSYLLAAGVAADSHGNSYVLGTFSQTLHLGSLGTIVAAGGTGGLDGVLVKIDSIGNLVWFQHFLGNASFGGLEPRALAVDNAGNIWAIGHFDSQFSAGQFSFTNPGGYANWLVKLSSQGAVLDARNLYGGDVRFRNIAADQVGNVLLVGEFQSAGVIGGISFSTPANNINMMVVSFNQAMQVNWLRTSATRDYLDAYTISTGTDGSYVVSGRMQGTASFGSTQFVVPAANGADVYVAKYDAQGQVLWANSISGPAGPAPAQMFWGVPYRSGKAITQTVAGADGSVYITGRYCQGSRFLSQALLGDSSYGFVARLDPAGSLRWLETMPSVRNSSGAGIALGRGNAVYLSGIANGTTQVGPFTVAVAPPTRFNTDHFVARLDGAGPLGRLEADRATSLTLYPNPQLAGAPLHLTLGEASPTVSILTLTDAVGHLVHRATVPAGTRTTVVPSTGLAPGLYILQLTTGTTRVSRKVLLN